MVIIVNVFVITVVVSTPIIVLLLALRYRYFMRSISVVEIGAHHKARPHIVNKKASYAKYKSVATKASVPNHPDRSSGDFLDFFLSYKSNAVKNEIEGDLSSVDCGDYYE